MENKNLKKFKELEVEFFSSCPNWTYDWTIGRDEYELTWDFKNNNYLYGINGTLLGTYKDIYDALDNIVINGMSLKQMLLETDFDFDSIN